MFNPFLMGLANIILFLPKANMSLVHAFIEEKWHAHFNLLLEFYMHQNLFDFIT